jgi:prepilin-type N-terminal cleavage/methylation domain-containing protein
MTKEHKQDISVNFRKRNAVGTLFAVINRQHRQREIENMRNDSGMTIFELMVVIGIITILVSIAVPSIVGWLPNYRMSSAADELLSTLWLAQRRAVRENTDVAVDFNFANDSYVVCVVNTDDGICDAGDQTVKSVQLPGGIDLELDTLNNFQFDRRGFPTNVANAPVFGNVIVSNGETDLTIEMTLAGSCSIQ